MRKIDFHLKGEIKLNKRPTGISILSVLSIIGGLGIIILQVVYSKNTGDSLSGLDISTTSIIVTLFLYAVLAIVLGVGMWLGKSWAWWLAIFYYAHTVLRHANALYLIYNLPDQMLESSRGLSYYLTKESSRIITNGFVFFYLFRNNVVAYFRVESIDKKKAIMKVSSVAIIVILLQKYLISILG